MSPPSSSSYRTSGAGGSLQQGVPRSGVERRPPRDARQVDFNNGDETHLVRLPQHPLNAQKPINGNVYRTIFVASLIQFKSADFGGIYSP